MAANPKLLQPISESRPPEPDRITESMPRRPKSNSRKILRPYLHRALAGRKIFLLVCALYGVSWLLPINIDEYSNTRGHQGASFAYEVLQRSLDDVWKRVSGTADTSEDRLIDITFRLIAGSPNFLFALSALLVVLGRWEACYFAALTVVSMGVWMFPGNGILNPVGGLGLWILTGVAMAFLAARLYRRRFELTPARLLLSGPIIVACATAATMTLALMTQP